MNIEWDAEKYQKGFSFVPAYGAAVADMLKAPEGSFIVDVGCGNGDLTAKLSGKYRVLGIDPSEEQIRRAKESHPEMDFRVMDALSFKLEEKADAFFSNAVFHWIDKEDQLRMLRNIASNLKVGGEIVAEFGGYGCAKCVHSTLRSLFKKRGLNYRFRFYFPTIGEYAPLLEEAGLTPTYMTLFDRFTEVSSVGDWIRMFDKYPFEGIDDKTKDEIIAECEDATKPMLYEDGKWHVDYVRIRFRAEKRK